MRRISLWRTHVDKRGFRRFLKFKFQKAHLKSSSQLFVLQMEEIYTIPPRNGVATGCLIFLHGSGDTGSGIGETVKLLLGERRQFPHIKILFPTAPVLPFRAFGGMRVNTWYDISDFTEDAVENFAHIEESAQKITKIIGNEVSKGIPARRIAVVGFSRGGALSYYMGYFFLKELAGVGVMSSWLPKNSVIYQKLKESKDPSSLPPLFQTHGGADFVISKQLAGNTVAFMKSVGIKTDFKTYPSVGHEVRPQMLSDLYAFVQTVIPDI